MSGKMSQTIQFCGVPLTPDTKFEHAQVVTIYLSKKRMGPSAQSMADLYNTSSEHTDASWFKNIITALAHIAQHPELCTEDQSDKTRTTTGADGQTRDKIQLYIEQVKKTNGVETLGYRFFIVNTMPDQLDLNVGMTNLIGESADLHDKKKMGRQIKTLVGENYRIMMNPDTYGTTVTTYCQKRHTSSAIDPHHISNGEQWCSPTIAFSNKTAVEKTLAANCLFKQHEANEYVIDGQPNTLKFPFWHLVQGVQLGTFTPQAVINMGFPKDVSLHAVPEVMPSPDDQGIMNSNRAIQQSAAMDVVSETIRKESDLVAMGNTNEKMLAEFKAFLKAEGVDEKTEFEEIQKWKKVRLEEFRQLWQSSNRISDPLLIMREWFNSTVMGNSSDPMYNIVSRPREDCKPLDTSLSPFGNFLARRTEFTRKPYCCISNHMVCLFMSFARLDCYRRQKELHINWLLTGAGNSGKSYALNIASDDMCIPHTFEKYAHETGKANAVCHDQLDAIHLYHEMPDHLLGISGNQMSNTGDYLMKNSLDSCEINTKAFHIDPQTGERTFMVAKSEIIRVVGGCTNEPPQVVPEALLQRFIVIMVHDHNVQHKRKIDFALRGYIGSDDMNKRKKEVHHYFCVEQYLYCMVEKLVWCKVLPDIDESIFSIVFRDIEGYCSKKGVDMTLPRNLLRVRKIARIMTILHAIEMVYHTPYSPFYNKPFTYESLLELAPYFIITEEIALCAIQLLEDQYFTNIEIEVLSNFANKVAHYPPPDDYDGYNPNSMDERPHPTWKLENGMMGEPKPNYNYLEFKGTLWNLANYLSVRCSTTTKHSPANINMMLHIMAKRKIKCRTYTDHNTMDDTVVPMEILITQTGSASDRKVYINRQYIDRILAGEYDNIFKDAMENTTSTSTRPRKIITTKQVNNEFGVLQTMDIKRHSTRKKYQETETNNVITRHSFENDYEEDLVAAHIHQQKLIQDDSKDFGAYSPAMYEEMYRIYWNTQEDYIPRSYPVDYIVQGGDEIEMKSYKRRKTENKMTAADRLAAMMSR